MTKEAMRSESRNVSQKEVTAEMGWDHGLRVGDVMQTVGGSGAYNRGEIVEAAEKEKYYRVDYGLGFPSLIREENLELLDEKNLLSEPTGRFVLPSFRRSSRFAAARPKQQITGDGITPASSRSIKKEKRNG